MKCPRKTFAFVFLFLMLTAMFAASIAWAQAPAPGPDPPPDCAICEDLSAYLNSQVSLTIDEANRLLDIGLYIQDSYQPVENAPIIIYIRDTKTGQEDLRVAYTNRNGVARFDFSPFATSCHEYKFFYCYSQSGCGFSKCFQAINLDRAGFGVSGTSEISGGSPSPGPQSPAQVLSSYGQPYSYCPPLGPQETAPAFCFPLILVLSLLGGALYLSGRNPLAAFDFSAPRLGKHIKYTARGRGMGFDTMSIAMGIVNTAGAVKAKAEGGSASAHFKKLDAQNKQSAGGILSIGTAAVGAVRGVRTVFGKGGLADKAKSGSAARAKLGLAPISSLSFKGKMGAAFSAIGRGTKTAVLGNAKTGERSSIPIIQNIQSAAGAISSAYSGSKGFLATLGNISLAVLQFSSLGGLFSTISQNKIALNTYDSVKEANRAQQNFRVESKNGQALERAQVALATDQKGNSYTVSIDGKGNLLVSDKDGKVIDPKNLPKGVSLNVIPKAISFTTYDGQTLSVGKDAKGALIIMDSAGKKVDASTVLPLTGALQYMDKAGNSYLVWQDKEGATTIRDQKTGQMYNVSKDENGKLVVLDENGKVAKDSKAAIAVLSSMAPMLDTARASTEKSLATIALLLPQEARLDERREGVRQGVDNLIEASGGVEKMQGVFAEKLSEAKMAELEGKSGKEKAAAYEGLVKELEIMLDLPKKEVRQLMENKDYSKVVSAYSQLKGAEFAGVLSGVSTSAGIFAEGTGDLKAIGHYFANPENSWLVNALGTDSATRANLTYIANESTSIRIQDNIVASAGRMSYALSQLGERFEQVNEARKTLDEETKDYQKAKDDLKELQAQEKRGEKMGDAIANAEHSLKTAESEYREASLDFYNAAGIRPGETKSTQEVMASLSTKMLAIDSGASSFMNDIMAQSAVGIATVPAFKDFPPEVVAMHSKGIESSITRREAESEKLVAQVAVAAANPSTDFKGFETYQGAKPPDVESLAANKETLELINSDTLEGKNKRKELEYQAQEIAAEKDKDLWRTVFAMSNDERFLPVLHDAATALKGKDAETAVDALRVVQSTTDSPKEKLEEATKLFSNYANADSRAEKTEALRELAVFDAKENLRDAYQAEYLGSIDHNKVHTELVAGQRKSEEGSYTNNAELESIKQRYAVIETLHEHINDLEEKLTDPSIALRNDARQASQADSEHAKWVEYQKTDEYKELAQERGKALDTYNHTVAHVVSDKPLETFISSNASGKTKEEFAGATIEFKRLEKDISKDNEPFARSVSPEYAKPQAKPEAPVPSPIQPDKYKNLSKHADSFTSTVAKPLSIEEALPSKWEYEMSEKGLLKGGGDYGQRAARGMVWDPVLKIMRPQ